MPVLLNKGDVTSVIFPFTDLSGSKPRPALVVAVADSDNYVFCPITTKPQTNKYAVPVTPITPKDVQGKLQGSGFIRVNRVFTLNNSLIGYKIGRLAPNKVNQVVTLIEQLIK